MGRRVLDDAIERSAAPATVASALANLEDAHPGLSERLTGDDRLREALVAVCAASRSFADLCRADAAALEVLSRLEVRTPRPEGPSPESLRRWKQHELLRTAARDLVGLDDLSVVGEALASLAAEVLDGAWRLAGAPELCVIGMGKLGGRELNYASDIDVLFVGAEANGDAAGHERSARAVLELGRTCFRVDANLRPEGRDGPLVRSLASFEAYWARWAQTWEFQALIKARPVAGVASLGEAFHGSAQRHVWDRPFGPEDLRAVRDMKARAEGELARRGLTDRELKLGRGGIRDIEFAVQLLQLVHARHDAELRSPTTLVALEELAGAGYVDHDDALALSHAYRFLRTVEHRLQIEREQQVHALPKDPRAMERLARVLGYRDSWVASATEQFVDELRQLQATVRTIHEHLFFRPLLDTLSARPSHPMPPEAVAERLAAFGFTDAARTRAALQELTRGLTRSSRLMQQMLPVLLGWLSETPDPDLGLLGLRKLASGRQRAMELAVAFRDSPESARRLCVLLGTSRRLADTLERNPDLIPTLGEDSSLAARDEPALLDGALAALSWRDELDDRQKGLQRYRRREELRTAAADILGLAPPGHDPVTVTAARLSDLAEAALQAALDTVSPSVPFAVIAMGRFGGAELSYASDLDLLFVYDGSAPADFAAAEKAAETLLRFLGGPSPALAVYPVDLDLRPEGKGGPLARSLDAYQAYYQRWAQVWERQALVRARPVAGDPDLGRRFCQLADTFVWGPLSEEQVREVRRLKARVERERVPAGEDPQFHLKLGPGSLSDVEWTAQLLQLRHRVPAAGTMAALDALVAAGALDKADRDVLAGAYRFCERTRNRWFLIKGAPADSLPHQPEQLTRLALSLGTTPADLRETYRRLTRRSRAVVERVFYGKASP